MKHFTLLLLSFSFLFSAPAFNKLREFKNADGSTFMAQAKGNHHLHWIQTQDAEILRYNPNSRNFEYAVIEDGSMRASGSKYQKNNSNRARAIAHINKLNINDVHKLWSNRQNKHKTHKKE
ncbi:hypothetical protein [Sulfurimonas sp.]|jgi:hypothetical protein|uniref:hypothetical protein n=1 Tax=Sulfurimonas sp. TaxID=2022749 RepID=UPI0025F29AEB|nr:hypothetical protein [Sulfurimonas sp.]MBT5934708.1 hypothetical protein [Sulfurimonas sp.]